MDPVFVLIIALAIYFLPTLVACSRNKYKAGGVFAVNLLTGWTLIGWVAALVMACMAESAEDYLMRRRLMEQQVADLNNRTAKDKAAS